MSSEIVVAADAPVNVQVADVEPPGKIAAPYARYGNVSNVPFELLHDGTLFVTSTFGANSTRDVSFFIVTFAVRIDPLSVADPLNVMFDAGSIVITVPVPLISMRPVCGGIGTSTKSPA